MFLKHCEYADADFYGFSTGSTEAPPIGSIVPKSCRPPHFAY